MGENRPMMSVLADLTGEKDGDAAEEALLPHHTQYYNRVISVDPYKPNLICNKGISTIIELL